MTNPGQIDHFFGLWSKIDSVSTLINSAKGSKSEAIFIIQSFCKKIPNSQYDCACNFRLALLLINVHFGITSVLNGTFANSGQFRRTPIF